jgi:hypothetical protein
MVRTLPLRKLVAGFVLYTNRNTFYVAWHRTDISELDFTQYNSVMYKDVTHKGKVYRIFSERISMQHPDEAIVAIFDVSLPGYPKEIHRESTHEDGKLEPLERKAELFVKNL